jgi:DNA-directed RNA polymerase specialized sigma24 family protein
MARQKVNVGACASSETRVSSSSRLSSDEPSTRPVRPGECLSGPAIAVCDANGRRHGRRGLAHDFFAHALERDWLSRYDRARGRFRTFLRSCLQDFASTAHEAAHRLKRGGHLVAVPLDESTAPVTEADVDRIFEQEWVRSVLTISLERLNAECVAAGREATYDVFFAHDVEGADDPPPYADLAARFAIPVTQVANYLHWARTRFRGHVPTLSGR